MNLPQEITDYLRGERRPVRDTELVRLIVQDALFNAAWSKATSDQWEAAISEALKRGLVLRYGAMLSVPVVEKQKSEQMDLF